MHATSANPEPEVTSRHSYARRLADPVVAIALAVAVVHLLTNQRYGLHRDELQVLSDALHLDWGFVVYPPLTPFVERIAMQLFGLSLVGLRFFSVVANCAAIFVTGLMARELGGRRLAQALAALAVAVAPLAMFEGTEFQYTTFDYLWWVLIAYFVVRLLKTEDARWCLAIGAVVGVGLLTKYTMIFYVAGVLCGLLLTPARRFLLSRWFWAGIALAFLIFLPNLIWQVRHDFVSLHFLQHIHVRDVGEGRAEGYWSFQFWGNANSVSVPLWIAGLIGFFWNPRFRALAWMYVVPVAVLGLSKGRGYYVGAVYPMLFAMGAVLAERWLAALSWRWRVAVAAAYMLAMVALGVRISMILIPYTSSGSLRDLALKENGDLREEIGWDELVKTVAGIRDSLPPEQRQNFGVLVGNYGEQGAIELLGRAYQLPPPISMTNSAWLRGYPTPPPSTLIVVGNSREWVDENFSSCRLAGHNGNSVGVENEESKDHPDIFVCGPPRVPWPAFWKDHQRFG
ncbi:MAG TPA: glycosyltransferase family 39 protein [Terriglobales bacterium]|nr:glycosyltransferase family 39 protein [Terriglobales bacterium]